MILMSEVLDRILDKGVTLSFDSNDLCCPDCLQDVAAIPASPMLTTHEVNVDNYRIYILSSVETFITRYLTPTGLINNSSELDCCLHVNASIETTTDLGDALNQDIPNNFESCSTNFNSCVDDLLSSFTPEEVDRVLDKGIVEYGSISGQSQICLLKSFIDLSYNSQDKITSTKAEILDRFLDKGIAISCYNGEMSISSVEPFVNYWYSGYITTPPA
jgi:hypothetical protein